MSSANGLPASPDLHPTAKWLYPIIKKRYNGLWMPGFADKALDHIDSYTIKSMVP